MLVKLHEKEPKTIEVSAAIIQKGGKFLVAQRAYDDELSCKWEFPGGKVENNESAEECIVRELEEELGVKTKVIGYLGESKYKSENKIILLKAFFIEHIHGEYQVRVHQHIRWVKIEALKSLNWAPADIKLVDLLLKHYDLK